MVRDVLQGNSMWKITWHKVEKERDRASSETVGRLGLMK